MSSSTIAERPKSDIVVAAVTGEVDAESADRMCTDLLAVVRNNDSVELVIDLTAVSFMDMNGIHALDEVRRQTVRQGQTLALVAPPGQVRRVLALSGLDRVLDVTSRAAETDQPPTVIDLRRRLRDR
jgi:anti-sigma B factor antagonist